MYLRDIRRRAWSLALPILLAASCNTQTLNDQGDACQAGQRRCAGSDAQTCGDDNLFHTAASCAADTMCDDALGCVACSPNTTLCANNNTEVRSCNADGSIGPLVTACSFGQTCQNGTCIDSCEIAASQFVYAVDSDNNFLSFEPRIDSQTDALKVIGKLDCTQTATPFSMAVDRKARAWVLYNDGNIFFVNPQDASCTPSDYQVGQMGFKQFGMGFVSDFQGSKTEQLYVGNNLSSGGTQGLARIDPASLLLSKFANFPAGTPTSPEMTGTGNAEWYGYFPSNQTDKHTIVRINKGDGSFDITWQLPPLPAAPSAWAFAHWGGRYYQFVTNNSKNQIRRYDPTTQMNVVVQDDTSFRIVGAGVSTCAPVIPG